MRTGFLPRTRLFCFLLLATLAGGVHAPGTSGTYRDVLRHRAFMTVIGLNALFIFAGFSG